jgi:anti-sigma-K factor RskA
MSCDELRDEYELYVLGVLDDPEMSEIRSHLARACENCSAGVRRARNLTTLIGAAASPAQPPARLKRRIMAAIGAETPSRSFWAPLWAAVAAAAIVAAVFFNVRNQRAGEELARARAESVRQGQELVRLNEALTILSAPDARQVVFGEGAPRPPRGRVFVDPKRGVLLLASNLPPAPAGKIYEMWIIPKGGKPAPAGLFQSGADATALHVQPGAVDVASVAAVAVTLEPAGGVPQPTSTPIIAAAL